MGTPYPFVLPGAVETKMLRALPEDTRSCGGAPTGRGHAGGRERQATRPVVFNAIPYLGVPRAPTFSIAR